MSQNAKVQSGPPHSAQDPTVDIIEKKPEDVFNADLAAQMVKRTDKLNDNTIELAYV